MIPSNALAFLLFLLGISPGYVYQRIVERQLPRRRRIDILQVVDLLCIGAACTVVAATSVLLIAETVPTVLPTIAYLQEPGPLAWRHLIFALLIPTIGCLLAWAIAATTVARSGQQVDLRPGSLWTTAMRHLLRKAGTDQPTPPHLLCLAQLKDGRTIGGQLLLADAEKSPNEREIVLTSPLFAIPKNSTVMTRLAMDAIFLKQSEIIIISMRTMRPSGPPT